MNVDDFIASNKVGHMCLKLSLWISTTGTSLNSAIVKFLFYKVKHNIFKYIMKSTFVSNKQIFNLILLTKVVFYDKENKLNNMGLSSRNAFQGKW